MISVPDFITRGAHLSTMRRMSLHPLPRKVVVLRIRFDRRADRARSSYDRPHRLTGNFCVRASFYRKQTGIAGQLSVTGRSIHSSLFKAEHLSQFRLVRMCFRNRESDPSESKIQNLDLSSMTISEIRPPAVPASSQAFHQVSVGKLLVEIFCGRGRHQPGRFWDHWGPRITENVRRNCGLICLIHLVPALGIPNGSINSGASFLGISGRPMAETDGLFWVRGWSLASIRTRTHAI